MTDAPDIYVMIDIETNGFSPGHYSMLSFAAVAFRLDKTILSTFTRNLELLPNAKEHPHNMRFWRDNPEAWAACRTNPVHPKQAMTEFCEWARALPGGGRPVLVGYPASFDHRFIHWYLEEFVGEDPFFFACLDVASYAMAVMGTPFPRAIKKHMPPEWVDPTPHTHIALDDAIGHARTFCNVYDAARRMRACQRGA